MHAAIVDSVPSDAALNYISQIKLEEKKLSYFLIAVDNRTWGQQIFWIHMREAWITYYTQEKNL